MSRAKTNWQDWVAAKERWLKRVASNPDLTSCDLAVAICLSCYLNSKTVEAWPSIRKLAAGAWSESSCFR